MAYEPASAEPLPAVKVSTGLDWLNRLLGGGLPPQSLMVLGGAPGAGKSILTFHMMAEAVKRGAHALLVTTIHQPVSKLRNQYGGLKFLGPTGIMDQLELFELDTGVQNATLNTLLNTIVRRIQEAKVGIAVIDSFRAVADMAENRSQVWRFLGQLSAQMVQNDCICVLVGEYSLPNDLGLPELAVADVVVYLEVERMVNSDLRTLRIYKRRGGYFTEGRQAFFITDEGIQFVGSDQDMPGKAREGDNHESTPLGFDPLGSDLPLGGR